MLRNAILWNELTQKGSLHGLCNDRDVVAIGPVVGVGQLGAEAVGRGGLQGVEIGERDPDVGQQVVHGDVLRRRDELGLALLPELITGSAFREKPSNVKNVNGEYYVDGTYSKTSLTKTGDSADETTASSVVENTTEQITKATTKAPTTNPPTTQESHVTTAP